VNRENDIMRSLMNCTPQPIFFEKNEIGEACSAFGGKERLIQSLGGET
jgi:hypothetical protein